MLESVPHNLIDPQSVNLFGPTAQEKVEGHGVDLTLVPIKMFSSVRAALQQRSRKGVSQVSTTVH